MFYSQSFLSRKGRLGAIWVAAYFYKKLKKAQVTQTDISSSVDKILQDEFDVVTYRILAYLLLGVVRIFSKKVEYLFDDCNKLLLTIKEFVVSNKDNELLETVCAPYFSITLPERFELDAFDLELEDSSGFNVMSHEINVVKDGMWQTGEIVAYNVEKNHCKEFTVHQDVSSTINALNEDIVSSYQLDCDMEIGKSCHLINSEATVEKVQGNISSVQEPMAVEMIPVVEEDPVDPVKSFDEDQQNKGEHIDTRVLEIEASDKWLVELSMQEKSICQEEFFNLDMYGALELEPASISKPLTENQSDRQLIKVPDMAQSESENHQVTKDDCNLSNADASMEKLRDNIDSLEKYWDVEMDSVLGEPPEHTISVDKEYQTDAEQMNILEVEEHPENTGLFGEEHQTDAGQKTLLETTSSGNSRYQVSREDRPFSVTIDKTPQSKLLGASGVNEPELFVIPTPSAKEGSRATRKRKCLFDDVIVFPNNILKQSIEDSSDLVTKRRKAPHNVLTVKKACLISNLPWCFMEPLLPCTTSELRSLFCPKKLKIPESLNTSKPQTFSSQCSIGRPVEIIEPLEKLYESKSYDDSRSVDSMRSLEKLNVLISHPVGGQVQTAEPPEIDLPETPTVGVVPEQMPIAPGTPVLQTKSLRSFESPERPEVSYLDKARLESNEVEKELHSSREQENDVNLMIEEINICEGDNQEQDGWSERTRMVVRRLQRSYLDKRKRREEELINLLDLLEGRTKKESARLFYEILVLKSKGYVHIEQETSYGDILMWKASQWEQVCGADFV